jgi:hypothetical protein
MPSIHDNNTAALLLASLGEEDGITLELLGLLSGIPARQLQACRDDKVLLPLEIQLKLSRIIAQRVPRLAAKARRLEGQTSAALRMQVGSTAVHLTAPPKWW